MPSRRVLFDTSAFYALISSTDRYHGAAKETLGRMVDEEREFWTTSYLLAETMALVHQRLGFNVLARFVDGLGALPQVFWIENQVHREAWARMAEAAGGRLGFVDWTTAVAANRLEADVFTFDQGFAAHRVPTIVLEFETPGS